MLMCVTQNRRQSYDNILKKYGVKKAPTQDGSNKPGRKRNAPAAAEESSEGGKKMKSGANQDCEGEMGREDKAQVECGAERA